MIAYLKGPDVTVEVPDDTGEDELRGIAQNMSYHAAQSQDTGAAAPADGETAAVDTPAAPVTMPRWVPNFYESFVKPAMPAAGLGALDLATTSEGRAFGGKAIEGATFGLTKPLLDPALSPDYQDHPIDSALGELTGGMGSLLATGGVLRVAGLAAKATAAGAEAADVVAAAPRFLPRAIMSGATFGTNRFIQETVKAFQDGNVDLPSFGGHVLKDTVLGAFLGLAGGLERPALSVASAAGLGFVSSKVEGGDNRESLLHGAIWGLFEFVGSFGKTEQLRRESLNTLGDSIGEYIRGRDAGVSPEQAKAAGDAFVRQAADRLGGMDAVVKSDRGDVLQVIEDVNQKVRQGKIQEPIEAAPQIEGPAPAEPQPVESLPAPPEPPAMSPAVPAEPAAEKPVKLDENGVPKLKPKAVVLTVNDPDGKPVKITHQMILDEADGLRHAERDTLRQQSPLAQFVAGNGGVRGFKGGMESEEFKSVPVRFRGNKPLDQMAQEAFNAGLLDEPSADLLRIELASVGKMPETTPPSALYEEAKRNLSDYFSSTLPGEIPTQLEPGVAFSSTSGDLFDAGKENVADRYERLRTFAIEQGMSPGQASKYAKENLKGAPAAAEPSAPKAKQIEFGSGDGVTGFGQGRQGEGELAFSVAPGSKPKTEPVASEVSQRLKDSAKEIRDILTPDKAAPLAAQITREQLGIMARNYDKAEATLEDAHRLFAKQPNEANLAFIDKMERGQKQEDPELQAIATTLRAVLDQKRKEIQSLGTGKLSAFIENYFPHIWDQGEKGVSAAVQKAAKRPLEGGKSFLKKRKIEFTNDGIEFGLTPVSYNPVELVLLKVREMDKYLMAHRTIKEFKDQGLAKYVKVGGDVPEGWTKIDDRISTVFKSPMIAVQEAFDEEMVNQLKAVAQSLGITLHRDANLKQFHKDIPSDTWGFADAPEGGAGRIVTRFAGPESVYGHELGHRLDALYGLRKQFLAPDAEQEFTALANLRAGNQEDDPKFLKYIQQPDERMAVMLEAYVHAPERFFEVAPKLFDKFDAFLKSKPELEPLTKIKPGLIMGTADGKVHAGGHVIAGHIWAQPDAARIINNYLSPGLQKYSAYQLIRQAGNFLNQAQLGLSFFHLGFTSMDAIVSKNALAFQNLVEGRPLSALKHAVASPIAPIENVIRGDRLLKAWRGQGRSPIDEILAEAMASAGGRARMDQFYSNRAREQLVHHLKQGQVIRGALKLPLAITEITSAPILEYIVPRQKLGVFADLVQDYLKNNSGVTHDELRAFAQRAWDSVDNRMGQLVYDNLFWNRTVKDLLMVSVRSVGWNLGTIREIGGGTADTAQAVADLLRGKKPNITPRIAYVFGLTFTAGAAGAIYQYLRTGKGPEELKDYVFPKDGGTDPNGDPHRVSLPSYMKDIYAYKQHPLQTILHKTNPLIETMLEMYENKDYYGTKIRNEDDPLVRQMLDEAKYVGKQLVPFSVRGTQQNTSTGNKNLADVIGPWIGITPAPASVNQTPAEEIAHEIASSHVEIGGRTKAQVEKGQLVADLRRRISAGDESARQELFQAVIDRRLSRNEAMDAVKSSRMTPLQRTVHSFSYDELKRVYRKANEEEKAQLEPILRQREISNIRQFGEPAGRRALP